MDNKRILEGEELYKKIETLKQVKADNNNWQVFYINEITGEKWVKEYPYSEMPGGGPPKLRLVDKFPWEEK